MDEDYHSKEAFKIHGLKGMAFSDSDSDEGMDTEDYKEYEPPPIDISKCHVYTITQTNQWEKGDAVPTNPWHNIPQNTGAVHQNVTNNVYNMGNKIIENKNNTENTKIKTKTTVNLNQLKGCLQLSEKSSHIYEIIKAHNQFPTTYSENSKKKMQELEEKFKSTKPHINTTGPLLVSIKDLVRALVVAFLFDIDVQESTIDMFQITTNITVFDVNLHFKNMMTQIMITPENVLFFELYKKLERLVLQRYKEVDQPCLNERLSRAVSPIDMVQNQVEKDVNSITKDGINNQVSESIFGNIQFLKDALQLSSVGVEIYFYVKESSQFIYTSKKEDNPLISKEIQTDLQRSFLCAKPCPDDSVYTRIRELVRAITVALLFGIKVTKTYIHPLKTNILQIGIAPALLKIEVKKHFGEIMALLQIQPENPIFLKLHTKLEELIIQKTGQPSLLLHNNVENTKETTEVSNDIDKISINNSLKKRFAEFLKGSLGLSNIATRIFLIIRSENHILSPTDRIFSAISEENRQRMEEHFYKIAGKGKTTFHPSDLPPEIPVKDVVKAVSVALLFDIDIKNPINHLSKYKVDPVLLKKEVQFHFELMMAQLRILPQEQIFWVLYKKVEKLFIPEVKDLNSMDSVHNPVDSANNFYTFGCDQNFETLLPVLPHTEGSKDIGKISIKKSLKRRLAEFLRGSLGLSKLAMRIFLIIRSENDILSLKDRNFPEFSEENKKIMEQRFYKKIGKGKTIIHASDLPSKVPVKDVVKAVSVALLFDIDIKNPINHLCKYNVDPVSLKKEVQYNFELEMAQVRILPKEQIFWVLYKKVEKLLLPDKIDFNCMHSAYNPVDLASNLYSVGCDQNIGTLLPVLPHTEVSKDINKFIIKKSLQKRSADLKFLKGCLGLSKIAIQIFLIIRSKNQILSPKDRIFPDLSEENRKIMEKHFYNIAGKSKKTIHPTDLPSEVPVKDVVTAVSVALLFDIDIKNPINHLRKYKIDPVSLKKEVQFHFELKMAQLRFLPQEQIFWVLYKKVEKLLIPEVKDFNSEYSLPNLCLPISYYAPTNIQNNLTCYKFDLWPYKSLKSMWSIDSYNKDLPVLSETSRKSHITQLIDNTQQTGVPNLNLANNVAHPDTELNVTNRVLVPYTGAIAKEEKKRKGKSKKGNQSNGIQKLLLSDINQVTDSRKIELNNTKSNEEMVLPNYHSSVAVNQVQTSREIELGNNESNEETVLPNYHSSEPFNQVPTSRKIKLKNTESNEKMVLPNYHSSEADLVIRNCTTEYSDIIGTDDGSSISDTQPGQMISERNKSETIIQPTVIESQSMSNTQRENNMENGCNSENSDGLRYSMSRHSVTEANIDKSEHHSTNDIVLSLDVQTPSMYSLQDQQVDTRTDITDHTVELNTILEEFLPGVSQVEEMVRSASNALVPYTNCESVEPEDLLLIRIRYLLLLYFSIVLGISFLDWLLTNAFSILMVILVVLFVK